MTNNIDMLDEGALATDGVDVAIVAVCVHGVKYYANRDDGCIDDAKVVSDMHDDKLCACCG